MDGRAGPLLLALVIAGLPCAGAETAPPTRAGDPGYAQMLATYMAARAAFEEAATAYWTKASELRRARAAKRRGEETVTAADYILTQPPVYAGPPRPVDPATPQPPAADKKYVPVVADFLAAAKEHFGFVPQRPRSESEFKRAYGKAAAAAGLTRDQIVRIYAFETGGNGTYDLQAGLEYARPGAHAVSPALGYNQLLNTNSVELLAERGDDFVKTLKAKAARLSGGAKAALDAKIEVLRRMIEFCRTVPDDWNEHDALANTPRGLGVHALVLDIDIGPLLQTQKLVDSLMFARRKGFHGVLTAAELEMMNLTGDGNGFDMVMMPAAMRSQVPTSNFFLRASYARNPVAIRNNVVAKLFAATNATMDKEITLQGAKDLAAAVTPP
jgi:hypothetical protein